MNIDILRYSDNGRGTLSVVRINGTFQCYMLEDTHREVKIPKETRIPNGNYKIQLRTLGGHHEKYLLKFPEFHEGMLQVMEVPGFTDILHHIGNTIEDTEGCGLTGSLPSGIDSVSGSTNAYIPYYKKVLQAIKIEPVNVTYSQIYFS